MSVDEPLTTGAIGRPNRLGIGIIGAEIGRAHV